MRVVLVGILTLQNISKLLGGIYLYFSIPLLSFEQEPSELLLWDITIFRPKGSKKVSYRPPVPGKRLQKTHVVQNLNPIR